MTDTDVSDGTTTALGHGLKVRHLTMMGLGSAIGAGLFLGTGVGIAKAGPAVLISYILAGAVVVFVMRMLGEMGAAIPASGSFSHYARLGIGEWAGFVMGWLYWFMLIMVLGAEITGASAIVNDWVPSIPQWVVALVFVVFFAVVNLAKVSNFGEFEFWFAAIKVTVIIAFLVIGVLLVFGILPDTDPVGTSNLFGQGGFMPNGLSGIAAGLLVVAFAFGGIEIVTIAAAESENPERSIAVAVRSVVWRISVFYIGAISIMVLVLPWNDPELESGPFVAVLNKANIPGVAGFMELVVVVALLSAFNANIYGTSRMAFSLSRRGDGPAFMAKLSSTGVPTNAVLLSVFFGFVSVLLNWLLPDDLLGILLNAVGAALLVIWIFIVVSHLRLRKQLEASGKLTVRMWLFPYLSYATLAMLGVFVVLMLFDADARAQLISTTVLFLVIAALGFLNARWRKQNQPA
ncbi:amino acid permease [Rhodococcus sp. WS1]|jgi:aromatic amino acid permease|uniref:Aromatic amino acid transport protein n=2 Tax=Rhodococcus erythropolis TaxID=1833 RepID=C1A2P6_RHOE4|nr:MULTISPECIES: amino acid permease [Rhodococcus]MCD2156512.1 amino acid permease [Rhodococcus cerastii]AGT93729.1 aromatic amino acid transport protein [Rhodococcus erythropolis CCM2595]AKD98665.1 amino acid transporter [Rhodococcus erythropolis]ALU70002.1 amino acid transporter [Rhodococcus erythropolis R138]ATI32242.1 amino acid permease [Rhodococcus sp. H-CA8f]